MSKLMLPEHVLEPLLNMRRDLDHAFDHFFRHSALPSLTSESALAVVPPIETWIDESDKEFHLTMPLPGLKPEEVNVHLQGKTLILTGNQEEEAKDSGKTFLKREFSTRTFRRSITLPDGIDGDKLTATLTDGILEITVPIAASALPKKIEIKAKSKTAAAAK